ncbi:hypothetical protein SEVIR_2G224200v4 [Setaria viridis]|uniref:Bifunctional inhibitor/plant lipid transfer protein/seed storage helical domain-containing protein n=3 Tax=Setaria TaxID=4554 RepID=A0A368Q182_SETIT|nr:glutelin-2 [Setaria italica]XP_034583062.1 glutelin-2-like [Setaria viridis]RCV11796.1 hypothetical protein SETIT_2G215200v2 [Setaria italica]TKW33291.1 hypothetical protein SEVIR_2G224200v2 [Setaria viridis]
MKAILAALALLALAVSATSTHTCPCHQQPPPQTYPHQQPPILTQCGELLRQQCSPTPTPYCSPQCQMLRQQCCQQIRLVEPQHQYNAIYTMVYQMVQQQQPPYGGGVQGQQVGVVAAQIAQQLTATCGMHQQPPYGGVPY